MDVRDDIIIFKIPTSKNGSSRKFVVIEPLWIQVVKKYLGRRPTPDMPKVFIGFRGAKPTRQNMGHNTISQTPKTIATFLKLQDPESYTGHTFRRSSATILAENGGDILTLKRHGGWKSSGVAEGYVEESISDKKRIAEMVQGTRFAPSTSVAASATVTSEWKDSTSSTPELTSPVLPVRAMPVSSVENKIVNVNIPVGNQVNQASTSSTSVNTGVAGIHMTCSNCTINNYHNNYYYK